MEHYSGLVLLLISMVPPTLSFNTGAPQAACQTLAPNASQHGAQPQDIDIPYVLNLSAFYDQALQQYVYTPDTTYDIVLESTAAAPTFRGFLIQARLVADDTTVVGRFENAPVGAEYRFGSCANTEGSVTHNSRSEKSTITIPWTAPSNGTGTIHFGYAVVRTRLIYWANQRSVAIAEIPCGVPFYLDQQSNSCVRRCPLFYFGNHTTAQCQPFPDVLENGVQADATAYFGSVVTTDSFGTEVFRFSIVIDLSIFNNDLDALVTIMVRSNQVERIFRFSDGHNQRTFLIGLQGGIDAVNASRVFPEIRLIENRLVVFEDYVIYQEAPLSTLELPTTLDFELNLIVVGHNQEVPPIQNPVFLAEATVVLSPPPDPCFTDPCQNGGTCIDNGNQTFSCECHPAYTGATCDILIDPCALDPCQNSGTCTNIGQSDYMCDCGIEFTGRDCDVAIDHCALSSPNCNNGSCVDGFGTFTCECNPGYTGDFCDIEIDECLTAGCQNGTCEDLINDFRCLCYPGWTGRLCESDIDYCALDPSPAGPCDDTGAIGCNDGNSTYMCMCVLGFTGDDCSEDIDECDPNPCQNGGNCTNFLFGVFECKCPQGYSGDTCTTDSTPCDPEPCMNGGTCNDLGEGMYSCSCAEGFTGQDCITDLDFCDSDTCLNGGTCIEGVGTATTCNCTREFAGDRCSMSLMFCTPDTCQNGGSCDDSGGLMINCSCAEGYAGMICDQDNPNYVACTSDLCLNGGTCVEEFGPNVSCNCTMGFDGDRCDNDLPFCQPDSCLNGGTCVEGYGTAVSCNCTGGFDGDRCQTDLPFCESDSCLNGGTCVEGVGTVTSCNCTEGFDGDICDNDLPFCQADTCLNGGICIEGYGTETICNCTQEFAGERCNITLMFCTPDTCQNGGTCDDSGGFVITCSCADGYDGMICDQDDPDFRACTSDICLNGGTCMEEFGPDTSCNCSVGFDGDRCEIDLPFCDTRQPPCMNGGTCEEGVGTATRCNCARGYNGDNCEADLDFCTNDTCVFGRCEEGPGPETTCECDLGYTGDSCNVPIPCVPDPCQNGGTCVPQPDSDPIYSCQCPPQYTGYDCEMIAGCREHSDCPGSLFCQISCPSDTYPAHVSLLVESASLSGTSFVSVPQSRYPDFSGDVSIFAVFRQEPGNQGYLFFYGTSPDDRNLAVFFNTADVMPQIFLFYTSRDGSTKSVNVRASIADNAVHYLAITVDVTAGSARFFLDGSQVDNARQLMSPNLTASINGSNQPSLFIGARLVRHYRFVGEIMDVVVFNSLISGTFVAQLQNDYSQVSDPMGQCVPYLSRDQPCPSPATANTLLCQSVSQVCDPTLRCLPTIGGSYTCQPQPVECSSDSDCMPDYFCGSPLPAYGQNYYSNPGGAIPGQVMFLQQNTMGFDGTSVISLPTSSNPPLSTDLTIFATVCQDIGNDGYIIGKGINDRMRDFGLYLRSTKQTVWLAYGADGVTPGFREILFFYNVTVADGGCHSVAAVIDSASNRAVLYIDGEPVGVRAPLPSVPEFRPYHNLLYVGGRPSTRLFRFSGNISNLFVGSGALSLGNIVNLHRQAFANGGINPISTDDGSVRYCYPYQRAFEQCYLNSFATNDFRCQAPAECIPLFSASGVIGLPVTNSNNPIRVLGRCVMPCSQDCSSGAEDLQCGTDGHTYYNACFRNCANIQLLHDGQCTDYAQLYASTNL